MDKARVELIIKDTWIPEQVLARITEHMEHVARYVLGDYAVTLEDVSYVRLPSEKPQEH